MSTVSAVWAVVLNFHGADMTRRCIASLLACTPTPHILLVDNGSGDEEWGELTSTFANVSSVDVSQTGTNLGYAGGMQWGIRMALAGGAEFIWLVNNDCQVSPESLKPLLREMLEHTDTGSCSGLISHGADAGSYYNGGSSLDIVWGRIVPVSVPASRPFALPERYEVGFVPGSAWLLRASVVREIGGLDCRLFLMGEEPDWCFRARQAGYRSIVVPESVLAAGVSMTIRRFRCEQLFYAMRNMTWNVRRQGSKRQVLIHHVLLIAYRLPKATLGLILRSERRCIPWLLRGVSSGLFSSLERSEDPRAGLAHRPASMR